MHRRTPVHDSKLISSTHYWHESLSRAVIALSLSLSQCKARQLDFSLRSNTAAVLIFFPKVLTELPTPYSFTYVLIRRLKPKTILNTCPLCLRDVSKNAFRKPNILVALGDRRLQVGRVTRWLGKGVSVLSTSICRR